MPTFSTLVELVQAVPAVLYEAEIGPTGTWTYVSPQLERLLGIPPSTFTGDAGAYVERIHPDDRSAVLTAERREVELAHTIDNVSTVEYRMLHADGSTVWVRDEARLVATPSVEVWRGVLIEVSRKHAVEEAFERAGTQVAGLLSEVGEQQPNSESVGAEALRISCRRCGAVHIATRARRCPICEADDLESRQLHATIAELANAQDRVRGLLDGITEHLDALHRQRDALERTWITPEPGSQVRIVAPEQGQAG